MFKSITSSWENHYFLFFTTFVGTQKDGRFEQGFFSDPTSVSKDFCVNLLLLCPQMRLQHLNVNLQSFANQGMQNVSRRNCLVKSSHVWIYREHRNRTPRDMKRVPVDKDARLETLAPLGEIDMSEDQNIVNLQSLQTRGGNGWLSRFCSNSSSGILNQTKSTVFDQTCNWVEFQHLPLTDLSISDLLWDVQLHIKSRNCTKLSQRVFGTKVAVSGIQTRSFQQCF